MGSLRDKRLTPQRRRSFRALQAAADPVAGRFAIERLESRLHLSVTMLTSRITTPSANPVSITAVNGTGYFTTIDTSGANHLWKTDGTDAGTSQFLSYTGTGQSVPGGLTPSNGKLFYTASGTYAPGLGSSVHQLYVTDGTLAGTTQLTHYSYVGAGESNSLDVNGTLFFLGNQGNYNNELWKSDGTAAGTVQLATWPMGSTGPVVGSLVNENGTLYFLANDATHGTELWKSDGTPTGTGMVADINPGTGNSAVANLTYTNGAVYFTANDGVHGTELWKTDGTAAGTALVKDINPGAASSSPASLTSYNGLLYFAGNDGVHGTELWQSDGTTAGTVMLADVNAGAASSSPGNLLVAGGTLYLTADDGTHGFELWKSDGTAAGTILVKDVNPVLSATGGDGGSSAPTLLTSVNGRLFFSANDGTHGAELWASDGTAAGTRMVADIDPGAAGSSIASPMAFGSQLVFIANDGTHGAELWASDGTAAGTTLLQDIYFGSTSSSPTGFANIAGKLIFAATSASTGNELWTTDGTSTGTYQVKNLTGIINGINPGAFVPLGDRLVFQSSGGLWASDGTVAGTVQIGAGGIDGSPNGLTYAIVDGELYFASGHNLWKTDGTAAGTILVHTTDTNQTNTNFIDDFSSANGRLYFQGYSNTAGSELWTSDGTTAGTYMVDDLTPGTLSSTMRGIFGIGGVIFFGANGALYKTDGTPAGTTPLTGKAFDSSSGTDFGAFTNLNGILLFQGVSSANSNLQLWRSDGTVAGTRQVAPASTIGQLISGAAIINGVEYFGAIDTSSNFGLWRSDGTDAGTYLVKSFGTTGGAESNFLGINGTLYFSAGGYSLWKSDGTTAGTSLVQSFSTTTSHGTENLVNAAGTLYFLDSFRVYTSDGTASGTVLADVATPQSSMDAWLTAVGDQAFFAGTTTQFGSQVWVITPPSVPPAPAAPATFSASAVSGGEIDLTWSAAANALAYQLQRSTDPAFGTTDFTVFVRDPLTTSYSDRTASPGVTYYYRIVADDRGGLSSYAAASASTPAAPIAPSGLTANPFPNHIDLSWTDNSANESGFKIERSFNPNFTSIDAAFTVAPNVTTLSDAGLSPLNVYFYRVTAFNAAGSSGTASAVAFTPDLAPAQPVATRVSASEVDLQWVDTSTTEVGFRVYRYPTAGGTPTLLSPLAVNTASYIDSSAAANVAYSYFIEQYGPYGISDSVSAACLSAAPVLSTSVAQLPGLSLPSGSGFPTAVVISNGIGFFAESDSRGFTDLWRTDGTAAGTTLVSATILGTLPLSTVGSSMVDMNGVLYFVGNDPGGGRGLCRSDG
ncbi:MAG TPA: ELWxxDGT repeat protein, partial [Tepidisphaeraceae bacterium]|nr:ELWxxDGT repeat protein [Tepidisphaeraceae bacterium]